MKFICTVLLLSILLLYEKLWRPYVCRKKIYAYINEIGGEVDNIEKLTARDEIFSVYYTVNGESHEIVAKFNLFYKSEWK